MSEFDCGIVLFSRTREHLDYGWLVGARSLSTKEHSDLRNVFRLLDGVTDPTKAGSIKLGSLNPVFCFKFRKTMVVVSFFESTGASDIAGRPIRCLQGYYSSSQDGFSPSELKSILHNFKSGKMVWDNESVGGVQSLNELRKDDVPVYREAKIGLDDKAPLTSTVKSGAMDFLHTSFNEAGYTKLVNSLDKVATFAFGALPQIELDYQAYGSFDLVAPITFYTTIEAGITIEIRRDKVLSDGKVANVLKKATKKVFGLTHYQYSMKFAGEKANPKEGELSGEELGRHLGSHSDHDSIKNLIASDSELAGLYDKFVNDIVSDGRSRFKWYKSSDYSVLRRAETKL